MNCHRLSSVVLCAFSVLSVVNPQTTEKQGLVQGQVVNATTGEPIRRATVVLNRVGSPGRRVLSAGSGPDAALGATTDEAGNFSIPAVEPGNYFISAQKTGFVRDSNPARSSNRAGAGRGAGSMLKLSPGQELKGIQLKLMPQAVLTGRVVDEEGEPVQSVQIRLMVQRYSRGRRQMMPMAGGETNDKGEYRLANLSPGRYVLSIAPNRRGTFVARADGAPETGYATLYYPGVQDISQATRLEVAAGVELGGLDFRLQRVRVYRVKGRVADANGAPLKNIFVSLMPRSTSAMFSSFGGGSGTRPSDGYFEIPNVTPGSYVLVGQSMEGGQQTSIQYPIDVGEANLEGLVLTPAKGQTIEGSIVVEGEDRSDLQSTRIMLAPIDAGPMGAPAETPDAAGFFRLQNVHPGKYQVMVFNTVPGTYVSSIKSGEREVLGEDVEVSASAPATLKVTLSTGAGQVTGTVIDRDGPGANATVVLVPQDSRRNQSQFYQTTTSDQTGAFSFASAAPGEYKVYAWEEVETDAWEDPDFMRPIADQGVTVRVSQRGTESARVKLIPASK